MFLSPPIPQMESSKGRIEAKNTIYKRIKCPHCEWSILKGEEMVGMTPCLNCNSTGYIFKEIDFAWDYLTDLQRAQLIKFYPELEVKNEA